MPVYFAYGANLDIVAMRRRCPRSVPIGPGRLIDHRFFIMREGVASVRREPGAVVHGLLWTLAFGDIGPLDAFEDVAGGLYVKRVHPVLRAVGGVRALLYVGTTTDEGVPRPGYLESVVAAARAIGLPDGHVRSLGALGRDGARGAAFDNRAADRPAGPVAGVTPRFASPRDRR